MRLSLRLRTATSTTCVYHCFYLLLSFRKQTQWEQQHSLAAWGRHSWTVNPSACGTTESDRETVKDVLSGERTQAFVCCIIFSLLCNLLLWHFQTFWVKASKQRNGNMFVFVAPSVQTVKGQFSWTVKATLQWGDPPGGTPMFPPWPLSSAHSPLKPCSCI